MVAAKLTRIWTFLVHGAVLVIAALAPLVCNANEAPGVKRYAWLLGEESYRNNRLRTVSGDVAAMATELQRAGWTVDPPLNDAGMEAVSASFTAFLEKVRKDRGAEVFVYLSGHGVELGGTAYLRLLPVAGDKMGGELGGLLPITWLTKGLEAAGASLTVVVFDACREHSVAATETALSWAPDPVTSAAPMQQLLLYAAASGSRAEEGVTSGGRFTRELISALQPKSATLQQAFERARDRVWEGTDGRQRPEMIVSSRPVLFAREAPVVLQAPEAAASTPEQAKRFARQLLADVAPKESASSNERALEFDIGQAVLLTYPPLPTSREKLERFAMTGSPGALLVLADALKEGTFGDVDLDRARAILANLDRSGVEQRLLTLEQQGSPAASMALAILNSTQRRGSPEARLRQMRAAAEADFLPAHYLHLVWTIEVEGSRAGAAGSERRLRELAARNDEPAMWSLAAARLIEIAKSLDGKEPVEGATARSEFLSLLAPYRQRGIGVAVEMSLRALFDPKLGPPMLQEADALCEEAWNAKHASAVKVCALTWMGDELSRKDEAKALAWMRRAAELGLPSAALQAGLWLKEGYGGSRDLEEAFRLFDACAKLGSVHCMVNAAMCLRWGQGTKRDVQRARLFYEQAAQLGNNWADGLLAEMLVEEPGLRADDATVRKHLWAGIEMGYGGAWVTLGNVLRNGSLGLTKSDSLAQWAYAVGSMAGSSSATSRFCEVDLMSGDPDRYQKGKSCLERMAELGEAHAQLILAHLLKYGIALPRDQNASYSLYERLLSKGPEFAGKRRLTTLLT